MASSLNPLQSSSSSDVSMRPSLVPPPHRSSYESYLSPESMVQYDQVFEQNPQNPHFQPLSNFSDDTQEAMKLGVDLSFVLFVEKLKNSYDPVIFLDQLENHTRQLDDYEEMGYEVSNLRERLDVLRKRAERDALLKFQIHELEEEATAKSEKVKIEEIRLKEMEEEVSRATKLLRLQKSSIFFINLKKKKLMEDAARNLQEFELLRNLQQLS